MLGSCFYILIHHLHHVVIKSYTLQDFTTLICIVVHYLIMHCVIELFLIFLAFYCHMDLILSDDSHMRVLFKFHLSNLVKIFMLVVIYVNNKILWGDLCHAKGIAAHSSQCACGSWYETHDITWQLLHTICRWKGNYCLRICCCIILPKLFNVFPLTCSILYYSKATFIFTSLSS